MRDEQNNDHAQIMPKKQFRSSVNHLMILQLKF